MNVLWLLLAGLATVGFWAVAFVTICSLIGARRAFLKMPEALRAAFEAPPTPAMLERAAYYWLIHGIATGRLTAHLWVYDPNSHHYLPVDTAERVKALAEAYGQARVVRWDADTGQFDETTVTPGMPLSEILG